MVADCSEQFLNIVIGSRGVSHYEVSPASRVGCYGDSEAVHSMEAATVFTYATAAVLQRCHESYVHRMAGGGRFVFGGDVCIITEYSSPMEGKMKRLDVHLEIFVLGIM